MQQSSEICKGHIGEQKCHFWGRLAYTTSSMAAKRGNISRSNPVWFWPDKLCTGWCNRTKIRQPCPRKVGELYPPSALVLHRRFLRNCWMDFNQTFQANRRRQMGWNRKRVVQTNEICKCHFLAGPSHTKSNMAWKACPRQLIRRKINPLIRAFSLNAAPGLVRSWPTLGVARGARLTALPSWQC